MTRKQILSLIISALLIISFSSCATNPVTGQSELMLMTESQEIEMGRTTDQQIVNMYGLYPDPRVAKYVSDIGLRMGQESHRPNLDWQFRVLDTETINAFAVPGGYIYVTRGILAYINNEAELAMILGHEIGHVTARHSAKAYSRQLLMMGGLLIGSLASETVGKYAPYAMVGMQLLSFKFSRDQERQSDDLGVQYAYQQNYDPREFENFFRTLSRMEVSHGGGLALPNFLSTHPVTRERIAAVEEQSEAAISSDPKNVLVRKSEFLSALNGITFGKDASQGYVDQNRFQHPDMGFSFAVPQNWKLENTPTRVQITQPSENAVIQFFLSNVSNPRDAFTKIISDYDLDVAQEGYDKINGFDAYTGVGVSTNAKGEEEMVTHLRCISKDDKIFVFMGVTDAADFRNYQGTFDRTSRSFKLSRAKGPEATKVRIIKLSREMTIEALMKQQKIDPENYETLLIINGVEKGTVLKRGEMVKIIK
jgi:predicted Zn-dependent protease